MKLLTLEDYEKAGETFWPKYWYVAKELGEGAKAEDIHQNPRVHWNCSSTSQDGRERRTIRIQ